ncbi:DNA-directed RNA polymerase [Synechococcus sp. MVIR-18-1]|uniref:DNA-directed RNA polymerase n=1 Tax=Synechococcus sp. MVIR-18-1 TaxID=1386941 RepID=UPI0016468E7F|nr:DNA-directed RNA polymerase [Synechococcus sp. MVIR-18-1]
MTSAMMAHITVSVILDKLGRGHSLGAKITQLQCEISEQVEHQAFIAYMEDADPNYFKTLTRYYLHDPVRRYDKKVNGMRVALNNHEEMTWQWMDAESHVRLGSLLLKAVMSLSIDETGEGFFEKRQPDFMDPNRESKPKKHKDACYIGFTRTGLLYRDKIQDLANKDSMKPLPMVCEPLDWSLEERGGYLTQINRMAANLIHWNAGSEPSQLVIDALNKLQRVPFRINPYILQLQTDLIRKSWEIGSFRTYEKDSWEDEHFPLVDSDYIATLDKESDDYKKVMRQLSSAYHDQKIDEQRSEPSGRTINIAEQFRDEERIYFPWFLDTRGRLYPSVSGLSPQGADYAKALLISAEGAGINEDTKRDLLISIATAGAFDGVDKQDFFERLTWAMSYTSHPEFETMILNPMANDHWMSADEPFCFLSLCEEFYRVFVTGERHRVYVFFGRDQTCSGVQILSALIGDEKAARFTNVLITEEPQDLYGEVAREARLLLENKDWMKLQLERREEDRIRWNADKKPDKQTEKRDVFEVDPSVHDRAVNKTQAMTCGYGATVRTRHGNIRQALAKKVKKGTIPEIHRGDLTILCRAGIQGMEIAFPDYMELNKWFKKLAGAALKKGLEKITWTSPSGMFVTQDYRESCFIDVKTYAAGGGHYGKLSISSEGLAYIETGEGEPKLSKNQSAIAANFTHSLDGAVMTLGILGVPEEIPVFTVHDCIFCLSGQFSSVIPHFRKAMHNVVTSPCFEELLDSNGLTDEVGLPPIGNIDLDQILESPYLFC